ncbi:MAG: hypothetical protein IT462_11020 [Planctomycetes bacterium]|nr:hypothetical protein [Planctomycetota bacterium]
MPDKRQALSDNAARQLATTTKTPPQMQAITPRWLVKMMQWMPVEAGTLRINRVKETAPVEVVCGSKGEQTLPETFVDYEEKPKELTLSMISTVLGVHTRVSDIFNNPMDQVKEQLRLAVEVVKERQEDELINNITYGLLNQAAGTMRVSPRKGPPTPDDMDELIAKVWKEPAFFLAHPRAVAAFGRECTRRGVPPPTVNLFGSPFLTWRGLPIVPCDKLHVKGKADEGKTNILLMRVGKEKQGVVGMYQPGLQGEQTPGLSVRFMGINQDAVATYLITLYCSAAVLTDDALGVLEGVEVGNYHEYK